MGIAKPVLVLSPNDFLIFEQKGEIKHEYVNGYIYAMVGASRKHNLIATTLLSAFRQHLRGNGCSVYMSDMKVQIKTMESLRFYYPDVMVSCDPNPESEYYENNPVLIVEVLSDGTEAKDRLEKLTAYLELASLQIYLLINQHKVAVDLYLRNNKHWTLTHYEVGETIKLDAINFSLPVRDIYEDVMGKIF